MSLVLAFGTFDYFHPGHAAYLQQASALGERLVVVIARDINVERIKNRQARQSEAERKLRVINFLNQQKIKGRVVLGFKGNRWQVFKKYQPDVIALGYDQPVDLKRLRQELSFLGLKTKVTRLDAYYPEKYKSSFLK
ncbi:MAG: adenylyltransferase/cytidyltransferase family protein [Patescibacteria group bacterium]|nr:adenylyltransferase/cytidyltransferase family protein [Patescibacteria group bacterium]